MKPQSSIETFSSQSKFSMHKDSHTICKFKPKIRIIHIVAPEIIKTDVEHFRELVQRLTGKPTEEDQKARKTKKSRNVLRRDLSGEWSKPIKNVELLQNEQIDINQMFQSLPKMKKEINEDIFGGESSSSSFFHGFGDMDCFNIQDLVEFPLLPFKSSQINAFGEMPLC